MTENKTMRVFAPLDGVKVIETGTYWSAPVAGKILAEFGADVLKVESPKGDPMRTHGPFQAGVGAGFASANHGKRSAVLDLRSDDDRHVFGQLLETADVLVENWRPGVADRLGFGLAEVRRRAPRLVRLSVNGYGSSGPHMGAPAFDEIFQGHAGLAAAQGRGGEPNSVAMSLCDITTAYIGAQVILAALLERERTGNGCDIELPMLAASGYTFFLDQGTSYVFPDVETGPPVSLASPVCRTSDGHIIVVPGTEPQFRAALELVGDPTPDRFDTSDKYGYKDVLDRIAARTGAASSADWLERFAIAEVPAGPILTTAEHLRDPQTEATRIYRMLHDGEGPVRAPYYPARVNGAELRELTAARPLGKDTDSVKDSLRRK